MTKYIIVALVAALIGAGPGKPPKQIGVKDMPEFDDQKQMGKQIIESLSRIEALLKRLVDVSDATWDIEERIREQEHPRTRASKTDALEGIRASRKNL